MNTPIPGLLQTAALGRSEVVANACMNRERNLSGPNSYEKVLGIAPLDFLKKALHLHHEASWLDLCCGSGRALLQAAGAIQFDLHKGRIELTGVDLVPLFDPAAQGLGTVRLISASVENWETAERFDLITCVHGLHYVGDKLGLLIRTSGWLKRDGLLLAHLDFGNLKVAGGRSPAAQYGRDLRRAGFKYLRGRHLLSRSGSAPCCSFPYRYLGADDKAGPNYTGQPAVNSWYERTRD